MKSPPALSVWVRVTPAPGFVTIAGTDGAMPWTYHLVRRCPDVAVLQSKKPLPAVAVPSPRQQARRLRDGRVAQAEARKMRQEADAGP